MKIIKYFCYGVFMLWLSGAGIMMFFYEIERKHDCIDREGLFKGLLWCDTDLISNSAIASRQLAFFLQGLSWPFQLFLNDADEGNHVHAKTLLSL